MPSIYPLDMDDKIITGIKAKIERHRDDDVLAHPGLNYLVERDRTRPWQDLKLPLVNITEESDDPEGREYKASIRIMCIVPVLDDDENATARLYMLKAQVKKALLDRDDPDLDQSMGDIGQITRPAWRAVAFDDRELEETILAGIWSFDVQYHYEPQDISGPALEEVLVTLDAFQALYIFGGQP